MVIDNNFYMRLALSEAWKYQSLTYPNPAVGCCIVGSKGEILAVEAHHKAGGPHAEVNALQQAYFKLTNDAEILSLEDSVSIHNYLIKNSKNIFENCTLYTTLEPCSHVGKTPSCATLVTQMKIKNVFVGALDRNEIAQNGNLILEQNSIKVSTDILNQECEDLLLPFKRFSKDNFVYFKWAQRLNATTDEGVISSNESRELVHAMRDKCDLLVIGGNTVREDRPMLDARLVGGKAPDILILSKQKSFDRTIPLFEVNNRKVIISNNLDLVREYKNIMIEGSAKMYELTRDIVDYYLCFVAPTFGGKNGFMGLQEKFEILNVNKEKRDIIMWMKRINTDE